MKSVKQTYKINAPARLVWQALTDPKVIDKWGGGPAKIQAKENTKFTLWGGDIHGTNTKVVKDKLLEQDWFSGNWVQPSKVVFELKTEGDKTIIELIHTDIPDSDASDIDQGWKDYYLNPIKDLLEK